MPDTPHAPGSLPVPGRSRASALLQDSRHLMPLLCLRFCFSDATVQTPPIATWVQAKRRRRGVGRAAWMPRERCQGMDARSARTHGASSECGNPTESDPTRSKAFLVTFVAFTKVTRCKSGTLSCRYRSNGYSPVPHPNADKTEETKTQSLSNAAVLRSNHCVR
jgi:hypothetical protein